MHGFPDNHHLYDRLVPRLRGRRLIVFDFLGWGRSDKPRSYGYTFAAQEEDLDAVVRYFGLEKVSLVAHDAAVPAAVNWALDHPQSTAALTLMNGFYYPSPTLRPPGLIALFALGHLPQGLSLGPVPPDTTRALAPVSEEVARDARFFRRLFYWQERRFFARKRDADRFIPHFYNQFRSPNTTLPALQALTADLVSAVASNLGRVAQLHRFGRPVRLIWGAKDPDLNTGVARDLQKLVPGSKLFVLPGAHHNLQIDEPRRVAELLLSFPR
jgi:pimeloyl-ACP methyl ester carboxylesterase